LKSPGIILLDKKMEVIPNENKSKDVTP